MLPDLDPPANLDHFRELAEEAGQEVRRNYDWGGEWEDEDGDVHYREPGWETLLVKEEKQADGRFVMQMLWVTDADLIRGWPEQWVHLIKLNELGFEATLEREGYAVP